MIDYFLVASVAQKISLLDRIDRICINVIGLIPGDYSKLDLVEDIQ